jgi:hypothetical protein
MKRVALIAAVIAGLGASEAQAARWAGETHGTLYRSNRLAAGGHSWEGSFTFTTRADGSVRGYAVVVYTPTLDLSGTDNALGFVRDVVPAAFGLFGPFEGAVAQAGVTSILGFDVAFKRATVIRRGPLTGRAGNGRVTLNWPGKLAGIPYDVNMVIPGGEKKISSGSAALRNPFKGSGRVEARGFVVRSAQARSNSEGTAESSASYWAAHRVG